MSRNRIEDFGPYQDAVRLFDLVVQDMDILKKDCRCYRLISQQIGSSDSICANMDEGFGRLSRTEFIRFLDISRGSARETLGRYNRLHHWLSKETIEQRVGLLDEIIARLTKTIHTLRTCNPPKPAAHNPTQAPNGNGVHEAPVAYQIADHTNPDHITEKEIEDLLQPSTPDTRHPTPDTRHAKP